MRIAFAGKAGTGKTTAAHLLQKHYGGYVISFASHLKEIALDLGWSEQKDERGRKLLQGLGSVVREYNPDFWASTALFEVQDSSIDNFFVDDCRFENECRILREKGFYIVYLEPKGFVMEEPWRSDLSEQFDPSNADVILHSVRGQIGELEQDLIALVNRLTGPLPFVDSQGSYDPVQGRV